MQTTSPSTLALVDALLDDPFYQAITIDFGNAPASRKKALGAYFDYSLAEARRIGRYVVGPNPGLGAAAWLLPTTPSVQAAEAAAKSRYLAQILGPRGNDNYHAIVGFMGPRAGHVVPHDAWYLSIVGIHPFAQGHGLGAQLLGPTIAEAARSGVICYLETFSARSQTFYKRLGFQVVASHLEPVTQSAYAVMRCGPVRSQR